ncbi:MAG TPA: T9SS type A sorting domain-containing protein [Bacteroidota bacterium]|nr:T9SS type A sorting domain-containing protein [Bacteroidota bacterium]
MKTLAFEYWRRRKFIHVLFLFVAGISPSEVAQSKILFVSPSGNDLNSGISIDAPLKTVTHGVSLASGGDTVYLLPGTYSELVKIVQKQGIAEKPIYIYGYDESPELRPVIDGGAAIPSIGNTTNYWMDIESSSWIEIGNIVFRNGWTDPIKVINSSYLTFNGCYFYGGRRVIAAAGTNMHHLLVQNCYWDQGGEYLWTLVSDTTGVDGWTSMHEGILQYYNGSLINLTGTGGSVVIRDNTIVNAFNAIRWTALLDYDSNIEIYDNTVSDIRDNDFEPEYYTFNLHIYHNLSHNIHKTLSVDHVQGGYIYYYGNIVTSDADSWSNQIATSFWKVYGEGSTNLSYPLYAFNNSFCGVGKAFAMDDGTVAVQVKHFNNAYYFTASRGWNLDAVDSTDSFDYDVSNKPWPPNIINRNQETHGRLADAQFMNTTNFDLRLKQGSPAIDGGTTASFPEFGWVQSYHGSAPDIGAYEGDTLVEGPPFRFRTWPGLYFTYSEKPRIVRSKTSGNVLTLYFSAPLDSMTIAPGNIALSDKGSDIGVLSSSLSGDGYRLDIGVAPGTSLDEHSLSIGFNPLPKGINGQDATMWAATISPYKNSSVTNVQETNVTIPSTFHPMLEIYPNPFNNSAKVLIHISGSAMTKGILQIYDVVGRRIEEHPFTISHGAAEISINDERLASGSYFAIARVGAETVSRKFIVLK